MRGEGLLVVALAEVGRPEVAVRAALSRQVRELLGHHEVLQVGICLFLVCLLFIYPLFIVCQDRMSMGRAYCNLGLAHLALGNFESALECQKYFLGE